jgi:hypothetical protein
MEQANWSSQQRKEKPGRAKELPVKVDIVEGADGLELHEIVFALQYTANSLRSTDSIRARYLDRLVAKYQAIQRNRFQQIKQYFHEKFALEQQKNRNGKIAHQDETR